jgi:transposase
MTAPSRPPRTSPLHGARKRGGQPHNSNARTHGMYSALHPSALTPFFQSLSVLTEHTSLSGADAMLAPLVEIQAGIAPLFDRARQEQDADVILACQDLSQRVAGRITQIVVPPLVADAELEKTALASFFLCIWQFTGLHGITRDVDDDYSTAVEEHSFSLVSQKSGQKSQRISPDLARLWWMDARRSPEFDPVAFPGCRDSVKVTYYMDAPDEYGWFTQRQWRLIAPLLPSTPLTCGRGRPSASSHAILSAVFWKLSHAASWDVLPSRFPAVRTCRRYYKRWFFSGRLMTIYRVLMHDLLARGHAHPFDLVQEGYFCLDSHRLIRTTSACPDTWQTRTALLFIQQSHALIRRIRREEKDPFFPRPRLYAALRKHYLASCLRTRTPGSDASL